MGHGSHEAMGSMWPMGPWGPWALGPMDPFCQILGSLVIFVKKNQTVSQFPLIFCDCR